MAVRLSVVIIVFISESICLADWPQIATAGRYNGRVGGYAGQASGGRVIPGAICSAVVGRAAAVRGTQGVAAGRGVLWRRAVAGGKLGNRQARGFRFGLLLDGIEAVCIAVGCVRARAGGASGCRR